MLGVVLCSLLPLAAAWSDPYHGKTLRAVTNYTTVGGVFVQDSPSFNHSNFDVLANASFGLIDDSPDRWDHFTNYITNLNKEADEYTTYKVFWMARHAQGYHTQMLSKYGDNAGYCYWGTQNGDGNITWADAELTPAGVNQSLAINAAWKSELEDGIPLPQKLYSSPHRRSASTCNITWNDILLDKGYRPYVMEGLREIIGMSTFERRSNLSLLQETYPCFDFEPSFSFYDEQYNDYYQESLQQQAVRIRLLVNEIFATDPSTFISITSHGGVMYAFFQAVGRQPYSPVDGDFVPVIVKAVSYPTATMAQITGGQSTTLPACTADPATLVESPATVTIQPTWYPECTPATSGTFTSIDADCRATAVTGTYPGATLTARVGQ